MKIVLENMLCRSKSSEIISTDGIFISVGHKYEEINQENRNPRNELEKFLFKSLGQNNFNNYYQKNNVPPHLLGCGL